MDAAKVLANYFELDLKSVINRIDEDINLLDVIGDFKIDLNRKYHQETLLTCRHATTTDDNLESIRKKGLLNLKQMLEERTPLSDFLLSHGISVNVRDRQFIYEGQILPIYSLRKHNIEEEYNRCNSYHLYENNPVLKKESYHDAVYWLYLKLYYDDCETEVFLNGGFEEIYDYDSVRYSPEILNTIENIIKYLDDVPNYYLQHAWSNKKNCKYFILEFDVPIGSFAKSTLHSTFERFWEISDIAELFSYTDWQYEDELIDKRFFINLFILKNLITKMTEYSSHNFGQISSSTIIDGQMIRVIVEHDVNEEEAGT
ncbi:hypothetical protein ACFTQ7_21630 [Lysinibacillus sp. NPDC056959]|uniref:hypothetical protein n=1 Tax=Lysinibacillus sp. NPDC056959 TaxID=3345981 RepID=UPI003625FC8C